MSETGLLLINLGTPTAPETGPVRAYLREFLSGEERPGLPRDLGRPARLALDVPQRGLG